MIYKYNHSTGALISSTVVTGLPAGTINSTGILFTGIPGKEVGVYDYVNQEVYFINYTTGVYISSCILPASAPTPSSFQMSYANNRIFLFDNVSKWFGYKLTNQSDLYFTGNNMICSGISSTLAITGATTYTWSTGSNSPSITITPTASVMYSVAATNTAGCTNSSNFVVTSVANPTVNAVSNSSLICSGQSATLTASGANSYTWSTGSNNATVSITPSVTTSYTIVGTNTLGCSASMIVTQNVSACTGIASLNATSSTLNVYPNPGNGLFVIHYPGAHSTAFVEVMDISGKVVAKQDLLKEHNELDLTGLDNGVYMALIMEQNVRTAAFKLIKN
jgi:hypothetical protein